MTSVTGTAHEDRRRFLESLAIPSGYHIELRGLPDGRRPDVLRMSGATRGLFLADAKDTETPGDKETQARLRGYLVWFVSHLQNRGEGVFSVCCGSRVQGAAWQRTLEGLSPSLGGVALAFQVCIFGRGLVLVWAGRPSRGHFRSRSWDRGEHRPAGQVAGRPFTPAGRRNPRLLPRRHM